MEQDFRRIAERAGQWIDAHKEEFITEIQLLARIPSVSRPDLAAPNAPFGPDCRRVLDHMLERGRFYGFETQDLDGYAGVISMGDTRSAIGSAAHLDVVPVGDGWIYPPFEATYLKESDALIGRGVDDNKSAAVMGLFVMRMLREWQVPMRHGVCLYCGTSEENGMHDMKALAARGHVFPQVTLVPDAAFPVNYGQKGMLRGEIEARADGNLRSFEAGRALNIIPDEAVCVVETDASAAIERLGRLPEDLRERITAEPADGGVRIAAAGRSGHAAHPERGINAIHLLARALTEAELLTGSARDAAAGLCLLSRDANGISEGADFEDELSGKLTLVYSTVKLQEGMLRVGLDCRYPITCKAPDLQAKLERAWSALGFSHGDLQVSEPYYVPKDSPYVKALQQVYHSVTGREEEPYTMGGGTYSRAIPNAISFGQGMPGENRVGTFLPEGHGSAHGRDEALPMEKVYDCARIYAAALVALDTLE